MGRWRAIRYGVGELERPGYAFVAGLCEAGTGAGPKAGPGVTDPGHKGAILARLLEGERREKEELE